MAASAMSTQVFAHDRYLARRKVFSFPPKFYVRDEQDNLIAFCKRKAFKLRDDIRIYADEAMTQELLLIKARRIIDFSNAFDVTESFSGQKVGALKRKGWRSLVKDEWTIMDASDREIGSITEDSMALALIRRFATNIIPQSYDFFVGGQQVGTAAQNWNLFLPKMSVDFSADPQKKLDRRLALAAVMLLLAIEGRQKEE